MKTEGSLWGAGGRAAGRGKARLGKAEEVEAKERGGGKGGKGGERRDETRRGRGESERRAGKREGRERGRGQGAETRVSVQL